MLYEKSTRSDRVSCLIQRQTPAVFYSTRQTAISAATAATGSTFSWKPPDFETHITIVRFGNGNSRFFTRLPTVMLNYSGNAH